MLVATRHLEKCNSTFKMCNKAPLYSLHIFREFVNNNKLQIQTCILILILMSIAVWVCVIMWTMPSLENKYAVCTSSSRTGFRSLRHARSKIDAHQLLSNIACTLSVLLCLRHEPIDTIFEYHKYSNSTSDHMVAGLSLLNVAHYWHLRNMALQAFSRRP